MFETFIIQPIFNALLILYTIVGDFGVAIILFTIFVRVLMWPLLRRNLHQGRIMRKLQPQIKEIKERTGDDRQQYSKELMELYKKYGVSPVGTFGLLFLQIPIFLGLFSALRAIIDNPDRLVRLPYEFVANNTQVQDMFSSVADKTNVAINGLEDMELKQRLLERFDGNVTGEALHSLSKPELEQLFSNDLVTTTATGATDTLVHGPFFEQQLFGIIDLSGRAFSDGSIYLPVLIIAILAGVFQYIQTKQLVPKKEDNAKSIKEIMREAAVEGKDPDQSEISAAMNRKLGLIFAPLITIISATSPSGLALYFATSGLVGMLQQRTVLGEDLEEMELVADVTEDVERKAKKAEKTKTKPKAKKKANPKNRPAKKRKR